MYVNAALIRELRMVYQHLTMALGGRTPASRFTPQPATLLCSHCFLLKRRKPKVAVINFNGHSLCEEHAEQYRGAVK